MPNIDNEKLVTFYNECFDWYGSDSKLYPDYSKLGLTIETIKVFCDGYIEWLKNENNPKELGEFQGDTTDKERVGAIISMEYGLGENKLKELKVETNEEIEKVTALAKQMKEFLSKKK
tara:strand:- start:1893 stop:2246 length:354 start_codon:yes stop_codon:yes gene_type:complete